VLCLEPVPNRMELTRDEDEALLRSLHADSVVVLTSRRHFWRTAQERLAERIHRAGFRVVLLYKDKQ
jgi:hypothetical protein